MPQLTGGVAAELAQRARALLRNAAFATSGIDPLYLRDAEPEGPIEALVVAGARQGCRRYASNPGDMTTAREVRIERACRPYLDSLGADAPDFNLPFRGGQCCGVTYQFTYTFRNPNTGELTDSVQTASNVQIVGLAPERSNQPAQPTKSGGVRFRSCPTGQIQDVYLGTTFEGAPLDQSIKNISIIGGAPDSCGNPPVEVTPSAPRLPTQPRREPFNPSPGINVDIDVEVNPDFSIDIDFGTGPITIDPFADEGGDGGGGAPPVGPGEPGSPGDTGEGGDAAGEAPEGQILTGLRINFLEPPIGGKEYAAGVYRAVCYIYMGTEDGLDHDPAGAMLRDGQFVYAEKDFLTRWSVSANAGYNLRVTPYYRPAEAEE